VTEEDDEYCKVILHNRSKDTYDSVCVFDNFTSTVFYTRITYMQLVKSRP